MNRRLLAFLVSLILLVLLFLLPTGDIFASRYSASEGAAASYTIIKDSKNQDTIQVTGSGAMVTLADIQAGLGNANSFLQDLGNGSWQLNANLLIGQGVTLALSPDTGTSELKMRSQNSVASQIDYASFVYLSTYGGIISIDSVHIHSWDAATNTFDINYVNGRAYLLAKYNAVLNISNAELSYLGSADGESYGVTWRDINDLANPTQLRTRVTGQVLSSQFHHNYIGVSTSQASNMVFENNLFHSNVLNGFNFGDFSYHFAIENNMIYNNGAHGLSISRGCNNFIIRNNTVYNNGGYGIYLADGARQNTLQYNLIHTNSGYGIGASGSQTVGNTWSQNLIYTNQGGGIELADGANLGLPVPTLLNAVEHTVSGQASPGATIEIFSDTTNQGQHFEGQVVAAQNGSFSLTIAGNWQATNLTAITIDGTGNASAFSAPIIAPGNTPATGTVIPTSTPTAIKTATPVPPTNTPINTPVPPTGTSLMIAGGGAHTCAVVNGGGIKCWGDDYYGQLGFGLREEYRNTPVDVSRLSSGVKAITLGNQHTCALMETGGAKCWGVNFDGELGSNGRGDSYTPLDVFGLTSGVTAIAAGGRHTCAVMTNGAAKCWGSADNGQVGDGASGIGRYRIIPTDVVGLSSGVMSIAAGYFHTCALLSTGGVKCWGQNVQGQLGDGGRTEHATPVDVVGLSSGVTAITAGGNHTCALLNIGTVKCWGAPSNTPVDVVGLNSGVTAIAAGGIHTCALLISGTVKCWGSNNHGQLGNDSTTASQTPVDVIGLSNAVAAIGGGAYHACAVMNNGATKCWGLNERGQLGNGTTIESHTPVDVVGLDGGMPTATPAPSTSTSTPVPTPPSTSVPGVKAWTLMFYLAGDNDLGEGEMPTTIQQYLDHIKKFIKRPDINIAVMFDGKAQGDSGYYAISDNVTFISKEELNSGDPTTLVDFVDWARTTFPSNYTALIIFDHGHGLVGVARDDSAPSLLGCHPFVFYDCLKMKDLSTASSQIVSHHGKIDVLFMQTCVMASIEAAYQIKDLADYYVASEQTAWYLPLDFPISVTASMDPESLALGIENEYHSSVSTTPHTVSVARLSKISDLITQLSVLAKLLKNNADDIRNVLSQVQRFDSNDDSKLNFQDELIDLYDFARLMKSTTSSQEIKDAATAVMDIIYDNPEPTNRYILDKKSHSGTAYNYEWHLEHSYGVMIFFSAIKRSFYGGENLDFAADTVWGPISTNMTIFSADVVTDTIEWGPMLVEYVKQTNPNASDDPIPPNLIAPLAPPQNVYLPLVLR